MAFLGNNPGTSDIPWDSPNFPGGLRSVWRNPPNIFGNSSDGSPPRTLQVPQHIRPIDPVIPIYPLSHGVITPPVLNNPARDEDQRMLSPRMQQTEDTPLASQASAPLPEADPPLSLNDLARMFAMFLQTQSAAPAQPPAQASTRQNSFLRNVRQPRIFNGQIREVELFLNELENMFACLGPVSDNKRAYYMGSCMGPGAPVKWFTNLKHQQSPLLHDFAALIYNFRTCFSDPKVASSALQRLRKLRMGSDAFKYSQDFQSLLIYVQLTDQLKITYFYKGLSRSLQDALVTVELPTSFQEFVSLVVRTDRRMFENRLLARSHSHNHFHHTMTHPAPQTTTSSDLVPMDIDAIHTKLTAESRQQLMTERCCFRSRQTGHIARECPRNAFDAGQGKGPAKA
jgi:Retrotransposon gag protein